MYDTYSRIAPTITQPLGAAPFQTAWQDATRQIGAALGREEQSEKLVTDLELHFISVRAQYPQFSGTQRRRRGSELHRTGQLLRVDVGGQPRPVPRARSDSALPPTFDDLAGDRFYAEISAEQLDLLDHNDVVAWITIPGTENAGLDQQPGYPALRVGQEGRVLSLTEEQGAALSFSSVLSLPRVARHPPRPGRDAPGRLKRPGCRGGGSMSWERTSSTSWSGAA